MRTGNMGLGISPCRADRATTVCQKEDSHSESCNRSIERLDRYQY